LLGVYGGEKFPDYAIGVDVKLVDKLIDERNAARKAKNFAEADRTRAELKKMGVDIEDGPQGTSWRLI
jgi:cysteinyl-tRNA synthetase